MTKGKIALWVTIGLATIFILMFVFGAFDLTFSKWYAPKKANIERSVFEETKSFVHGQTQLLAKLYGEWNDPDTGFEDKTAIEELIKMQIADLSAENVSNETLRKFLIKTRGY